MINPTVSIVIPSLARPDDLAACLDSIDATVAIPHEVVCVTVTDDESTQELMRERKASMPNLRNLSRATTARREGYVRAANAGLRAARGMYVTHLNDDCKLRPHAIDNAVAFLEAPAHAGIGLAAFFHDSRHRRNPYAQLCVGDTTFAVDHVRGLCYANFGLALRSLYVRLEWLDERYFMYGADPDFSLKVWHEAGLVVAPCPGSFVHHAEREDARALRERAAQDEDNARLFARWNLAGEPRAATRS